MLEVEHILLNSLIIILEFLIPSNTINTLERASLNKWTTSVFLKDNNFITKTPNTVEWLPLLLCILEVPGLNIGPETGYPDRFLCCFPQSLQASDGMVFEISPWMLPSTSFPFIIYLSHHLMLYSLSYWQRCKIKYNQDSHEYGNESWKKLYKHLAPNSKRTSGIWKGQLTHLVWQQKKIFQ